MGFRRATISRERREVIRMPRRTPDEHAIREIGRRITRLYQHGHPQIPADGRGGKAPTLVDFLLRVANEPVESWRGDVNRLDWRQAWGEPLTGAVLDQLRAGVREDLADIVDSPHHMPRPRSNPHALTLFWWPPIEPDAKGESKKHRRELSVQIAPSNLDQFLDWAVLILIFRDAKRLRRCDACSRFFLVSDARVKGILCRPRHPDCPREARRAEQKLSARVEYRKRTAPLGALTRKIQRDLGR